MKRRTAAAATAEIASKRKNRRIMLILTAVLVAFVLLALSVGRYSFSFLGSMQVIAEKLNLTSAEVDETLSSMVLNVRLPRALAAVLVGAALSVSGATYQAVFRNPLVSPDILGVSAGSCVGAALGILLHFNSLSVQVMALAGGLASVILAVTIPRFFKNRSTLMLILSGVLVSGFMNSIVALIKYMADPDNELADIVYWTMGSFSSVRWTDIQRYALVILVFLLVPFLLRWRLNVMALGDREAYFLGVNVRRTRGIFIFSATILTSTAICICGTIGYVGLIVPHFCRLFSGSDNRIVVPASILAGASFMLLIDTLARTVSASEVPLSVFTGVLGVPLFIWLLAMQKTRFE